MFLILFVLCKHVGLLNKPFVPHRCPSHWSPVPLLKFQNAARFNSNILRVQEKRTPIDVSV